ncbi:protein kinase 2B [Perilla frutescens var. hirtella]|uniref:non-specific serine/threonine protein kinase n=1 Tax=Perilla frutescens var. hirtella TaxID=608512 RepID=A0AAD4J8K6_PERFH|nr:protein kinase 2B [Perilla frutescens var. hirtella]
MSRIYDNWEKLVGAVVRREKDRRLALFQSFSSSSSIGGVSSRLSFDAAVDTNVSSRFSFDFNPFVGDVHVPAGDKHMDEAGSSNWDVGFQPLNEVSSSSSQKFDPADLSNQNIFFFRNVMAIEYEEIKKATKNFKPDLLLGEGGFGPVYKGWIHEHHLTAVKPGSGIAVAVKKLNTGGYQGRQEWVDEINYLSQLRHPNLVKLIGYSFDTDNRIVVYEFMHRGSLDNHLFRRRHQVLPWATRIKVAVGAARALAFLHNLEVPIIHRNIKCSDILLDDDFNTKLSDFGLARDGPTGDMTHVSTRVMGTYGYAAPEYLATGHLTTRCDVYGFGVVLVELISGLRVIDKNRPHGEHYLMKWAKPYLGNNGKLSRIMDSRLEGRYPHKAAYEVGKIALQCVSSDPSLRPAMAEVVAALENL